MLEREFTKDLSEIAKNDANLVGGKAATLGELKRKEFPVPDGFVITIRAYREFMQTNQVDLFIDEEMKLIDCSDTQ